jgi:hypothetical protein
MSTVDVEKAACCYAYIRQYKTDYQSCSRLNLLNLLNLYSNSVNADLVSISDIVEGKGASII